MFFFQQNVIFISLPDKRFCFQYYQDEHAKIWDLELTMACIIAISLNVKFTEIEKFASTKFH